MAGPVNSRRLRTPSIEDVARIAGVSAQTVSRVANASSQVRPATRELVIAAMNQLGYVPNRAARALRSGEFGTLGVIAPTFERTGEALITQSVVEAADVEGYSVTLLTVRDPVEDHLHKAMQSLSHQAADGLIIIRADKFTPESLTLPPGMPVVTGDARFIGDYPSVGSDEFQGSADAVAHLLGLGHRTVHHITGPLESDYALARVAAWEHTLRAAGITPPAAHYGDWSAESGYHAGVELLREDGVTAVFVANDDMAFGLMRAAHEAGRRIPDDLSIVGFDGILLGEFTGPPLTTVKQDFHRAGRELVRVVLKQLAAPGSVGRDEHVLLPTSLLVRGTTAPPTTRDS